MQQPPLVLWNDTAGSDEEREAVRAALARRSDLEIRAADSAEASFELAKAAATEDRLVIAAGGDGTIHKVLQGLMAADACHATLAVLPLGTANDLCRTLAIEDAEQAVELWERPRVRKLDVIRLECDDGVRFFVNAATGGNAARVGEHLTHEMKQRWGGFSYLRGAVEVWAELETYPLHIEVDGNDLGRLEVLNVVIGNGRFAGGGVEIAPRASPEDGLLDLVVAEDGPALDLVGAAVDLLRSDHLEHPLVTFRQGTEVELRGEDELPLSVDGDTLRTTCARFTVIPAALQVVVGRGYRRRGAASVDER